MLTLEIEFLSGVCYAGTGNDRVPEYPPQPDRAFSALVSAWGARGCRDDERAALEWLERQAAPRIAASGYASRTIVDAFVPPNDAASGRVGSLEVLPAHRRRQPRRFPALRPDDPTMRFVWMVDPDTSTLETLDRIAGDVTYLGHSTSLVRARFLDAPQPVAIRDATRAVYPGRLGELERAYHRGERPAPGAFVAPTTIPKSPDSSIFDSRWLVLPGLPGWTPDARAFPVVAKCMRDALMASFGRHGLDVPEWISGHAPDGQPTRHPHLAIVPMLDIGFSYSESNVLGMALVPPRGTPDAEDVLIRALLRLRATSNASQPHMTLVLNGKAWNLAFTDDDARESLKIDRWITSSPNAGSSVWASATPIVLDRHPHARDASAARREIEEIIGKAFAHIGLEKPIDIQFDSYSSVSGALSAKSSKGSPPWMRWKLPDALASRPLVHASFRFAEPVRGPMIVGSGRFVGLGLCLPLKDENFHA